MTTEKAISVLESPLRPLALAALSYVNLKDNEQNTLILRYMRGYTQEETAEYLERHTTTIQRWESAALEKCVKAWDRLCIIDEILNATK